MSWWQTPIQTWALPMIDNQTNWIIMLILKHTKHRSSVQLQMLIMAKQAKSEDTQISNNSNHTTHTKEDIKINPITMACCLNKEAYFLSKAPSSLQVKMATKDAWCSLQLVCVLWLWLASFTWCQKEWTQKIILIIDL